MHRLIMQIYLAESYETVKELIFLLGGFILLLQLFIFLNRLFINYRTKRKKELKEKYELLLSGVLFLDEEDHANSWDSEKDKLVLHFKKHYMRRDFNRKVLVDELLQLHRTFKGALAERAKDLYYDLGLDKTGIRKMASRNATVRANIIRDLAQMDVKAAIPAIRKQVKHPSPAVRLEAKIALFKLDDDQLFGLLDQDQELSKWEQIKLFEVFRHFKRSELPSFHKWLFQRNESIQLFCLELIAFFKQYEAADDCIQLLKTENLAIRTKALQVLSTLNNFDFLDEQIQKIEQLYLEEKIALMECIAASAEARHKVFCEEVVCNAPSKTLALAAGRALLVFADNDFDKLEMQYAAVENEQLHRVIQHLKAHKLA